MAQLGNSKAKSGGQDRKQVVLVPNGLYAGMFGGYTLPKEYPGYQGASPSWKMFVWWVLTHDRTNTQLPRFSSALLNIPCVVPEGQSEGVPKLFYDPESQKMSSYVAFMYAMKGGKVNHEDLVNNPDDPDFDEFVGKPAILFIQQGKPAPNGLVTQKVTSIQPADTSAQNAILPLWKSKVVSFTEHTLLAYLSSPAPSYEGETEDTSQEIEDDTELIPF